MKFLKKVAAIVLIAATVLSLTACGPTKKKVEPKDFKKKLEKKGFYVEEAEDEDAEENYYGIYYDEEDDEVWVLIDYYLFDKASDAKSCFNASYDSMKKEKDKGKFDGETTKNTWKFTGDGEFTDDSKMGEGEYYIVGIVAEEMVIIAYSYGDKTSRKVLDDTLADLGY